MTVKLLLRFKFLKGKLNMGSDAIIEKYLAEGRIPWSKGYSAYKYKLVSETLESASLMKAFREGGRLPQDFGPRIDERIVEYPWVMARLDPASEPLLDAGSVFNKEFLLKRPEFKNRRLIIYTLATDWITYDPNISYIFGDFREMLLRDECIPSIVCMSTLEHVGMGQTVYNENSAPENNLTAYREVMKEFHRVLRPKGQLLLTVPFGRAENHGWLQQFDAEGLRGVISSFPGQLINATYYLYSPEGWQVASQAECADASYYNIHDGSKFGADYAAAARSVACLEFHKA